MSHERCCIESNHVAIKKLRPEISSDRPVLVLSADGETVRMDTPLRYRIRPKALRLIAPAR